MIETESGLGYYTPSKCDMRNNGGANIVYGLLEMKEEDRIAKQVELENADEAAGTATTKVEGGKTVYGMMEAKKRVRSTVIRGNRATINFGSVPSADLAPRPVLAEVCKGMSLNAVKAIQGNGRTRRFSRFRRFVEEEEEEEEEEEVGDSSYQLYTSCKKAKIAKGRPASASHNGLFLMLRDRYGKKCVAFTNGGNTRNGVTNIDIPVYINNKSPGVVRVAMRGRYQVGRAVMFEMMTNHGGAVGPVAKGIITTMVQRRAEGAGRGVHMGSGRQVRSSKKYAKTPYCKLRFDKYTRAYYSYSRGGRITTRITVQDAAGGYMFAEN